MEISFIKIPFYELRRPDVDIYNYIHEVCAKTANPPSDSPKSLDPNADIIFHSTLRRCVTAIKFKDDKTYIPLRELEEVPFDSKLICSREEWDSIGSVAIRRGFNKLFVNDQLLISRASLEKEAETIINKCKLMPSTSTIVLVSHSFRMKVMEAYLQTKGKIFQAPELIEEFIPEHHRTFDFCQGFKSNI